MVLPLGVVFALAKYGIAPWIVRRNISGWFAERSYGRLEIRSASVGFRELRLYGLSLTDRAGRVYGTAESVVVRFDRSIITPGNPAIVSLLVVHPELSATLEPDGVLDLQKLLARPPEAPPPSAAPIRPPPVIDVERAVIHFRTDFFQLTLTDIDTQFQILSREYGWTGVDARVMGGRASLSGAVSREEDGAWSVQINLTDASVREMVRGTALESRQLDGRVNGFLSIERGDGPNRGPIGAGWLDVEDGRLLELPVLLSVFNVLRLNAPGDAHVSACHSDFRLLDDRLHFDRFYIVTEGICLFGDGDIFFASQNLDLNFIPCLIGELPPGFQDVREAIDPATDFLAKNLLFDVEIKGTWTDPEPRPLPVRFVTKPFADLIGWLKDQQETK